MKKSEKKNKGKTILIMCLIFVSALLVLMSPLFGVSEITVDGNERFTSEQIEEMAGINKGNNILRFSFSNGEEKLLENVYIKFANIEVNLPNKLKIEVIERKTCGYVPYMGAYLYIDQDGYVLDNRQDKEDACPVVTGLVFDGFSIGEKLIVDNKKSFEVVMTMSKVLLNNNFIDFISEMNISNPDEIHLYVDNIDISFGNINEADKKVRTIIEMIKVIPKGDKGVLHLEEPNIDPYFSYTL